MAADPKSRPDLLGFLQEQIQRRESFRLEIDRSIEVLREAEKELRRILPGAEAPAEAQDDLPYRIQPHEAPPSPREPLPRPAPQARWEEPAGGLASPLERPLPSFQAPPLAPPTEREPIPQPLDLPRPGDAPRRALARGVDEALQEEQMLLLGMNDVTSSRRRAEAPPRAGGPAHPPVFHSEEEAPPPGPARAPHRREEAPRPQAPGPQAPAGPSVQKLMDYIRLGGAVRCLDPWNRTCAAFVFRSNGSAIFATDVFVNYLRAVFARLKPERTGEPESGLLREAVPQMRFLASLVEALQSQRLLPVRSVKGLQLAGGQKLPPGFEFEASTRDMMNPALLERLQAVLRKPPAGFFLPGGPYSEVRGYLAGYQAFCRTHGEESRAAAMLIQIGLEEAGKTSTPAGIIPAGIPPSPEDTRAFMEEAEALQDLNTFDFSPEDQKSILAQREDAFSMSAFRRPNEPGRSGPEESSPPVPGPAAPENARKDEEIRNFLKGLGIEWKG